MARRMPRDTCAEETLKGASHAALQGSGVDSTEILRSNGFAPRRASDPVSLWRTTPERLYLLLVPFG